MRFEARHQFAKNVMSNTFCFKNVAKTVCKRSQLQLAYTIFTDNFYRESFEVGPATRCLVTQLDTDVAASVTEMIGIGSPDDVCIPNWFRLGHYRFHPEDVVMLSVNQGIPSFGRIRVLVSGVENGVVYVVVDIMHVHEVNFHIYSYEVSMPEKRNVKCLKSVDLHDFHPLGIHCVQLNGSDVNVVCPGFKLL
jgi:hypothetical protein